MTSENNPETGTILYSYDTDSTCGTSKGDLVKRQDAVGNVTCYAYDALHRLTAITYPSGPYTTAEKHFVYDAATVNGAAMANAKGHLAEAYTGPAAAKITDLGFSYSVRGEVTDTYEATPNSQGYYHVAATYWPNGLLNTLNPNLLGLPTWTYTPDGEGRVYSVAASSGQNPLSSTNYGLFGPTTVTFGSGDSDNFSYDANTGRETQYAFAVNGATDTGMLTWNKNGTLRQLAISDPFLSSDNQTCNNLYDDLMRLSSNNCGSVWNQIFSYDAFGNIAKSGSISFQPTYSSSSNRYATLPAATPTYHANGNLTSDGFHTYNWDAEGKNTSIDSGATTVTYDAFGRWVEKVNSGFAIQAVYAPNGQEIAVPNGHTQLLHAYVALPAGAMAHYTGSTLSEYWHPDWLGTPRLATNPSRGVTNDMAFAPYGEQYVGSGTSAFFTGAGQLVEANDFLTFAARNYHMTQGRWLNPDPAGRAAVDFTNPQSWNAYAYVLGNPLGYVDPSGMAEGTGGGGSNGPAGPAFDNSPCTAQIQLMVDQQSHGSYFPSLNPTQNCGPTLWFTPGIPRIGAADGSSGGSQQQPPKSGTPAQKPLACQINSRAANIPGGQLLHSIGINHEWITTSTGVSVGMGTAKGVPQSDYPGVQTQVVNHTGQVPTSSVTFNNVDPAALNTYIKVGTPTGPWIPIVNDCNTWANQAIYNSTPHNLTYSMYGIPITYATGVVVYADGSIHQPGGN